ncbi:MAG: transposase family protein [Polyangiaceae bacterium]
MARTGRMKRRVIGVLHKRMGEVRLDQIPDSRDRRGRRWRLDTLLTSALFGLVAGCRSLREVEQLTAELARPIREKVGIPGRVPDTTLRDALSSLEPDLVRPALHAATRTARRGKALDPDSLPFGVVSLDGKSTAVFAADDFLAAVPLASARTDRGWSASRMGSIGCSDGLRPPRVALAALVPVCARRGLRAPRSSASGRSNR